MTNYDRLVDAISNEMYLLNVSHESWDEKAAKLKEGDEVNWVDNGDGSFSIRKVNKFVRGECYDDFENPCDMVKSQDEQEELDVEYEAIRAVGGYDWTPKK